MNFVFEYPKISAVALGVIILYIFHLFRKGRKQKVETTAVPIVEVEAEPERDFWRGYSC